MTACIEDELLLLSERLLQAIDSKDWETYTQLCDVSLTAYEPEALGQLVEGLPFHYFYLNDLFAEYSDAWRKCRLRDLRTVSTSH